MVRKRTVTMFFFSFGHIKQTDLYLLFIVIYLLVYTLTSISVLWSKHVFCNLEFFEQSVGQIVLSCVQHYWTTLLCNFAIFWACFGVLALHFTSLYCTSHSCMFSLIGNNMVKCGPCGIHILQRIITFTDIFSWLGSLHLLSWFEDQNSLNPVCVLKLKS